MNRKKKILLPILLISFFSWGLHAQIDVKKKLGLNKPYNYYKAAADRYRILGNYPSAIRHYEYALAVNSNCAECYYQLGKIKYKKGLNTEAIQELQQAILRPFHYSYDRVKSYYLLAGIYFEIKRDGKALSLLDALTKEYENYIQRSYQAKLIEPLHYAPAFFLIGLYYRNQNLLDKEKIQYFAKSMEMNYKKDFANYFLYEYYRSQSPDTAFRYLNQAMTINSNIQKDLQEAKWIDDYKVFIEEFENL
jgi:tetratricopeptide (TPR) repeat protein